MWIGKLAATSLLLFGLLAYPVPGQASTTPIVAIKPTTAGFGAPVGIEVLHFASKEAVNITWDSPSGPLLTTLTTFKNGAATGQFTVPEGVYGRHTIYATGQKSLLSASTTIQEIAGITLNRNFGQPGFGIVVSGGGYLANETVQITFGPAGGHQSLVATVSTDSNGGFVAPSFPATNTPSGPYTVYATGQTSGYSANTGFFLQNYSMPVNANVTATFGQPFSSSYNTQVNDQLLGTNLELAYLGPYFKDAIPTPVTTMLNQMQPGVVRLFVAQQNVVLSYMNQNTDYHDYFWTKFDWAIQYIESNHMIPEVVLWQVADYNAPSGVPNRNTAYPLDPNEWGRVSANFVRHANLDMGFSIHYWEIWNEPNVQEDYQDSMTVSQYVTLFDDAVTQMKAVDPTIAVGGPEISSLTTNANNNWMIPFLKDPTVEQNVDFITWHGSQYDLPKITSEIAMVRQDIQKYDPSRASVIGLGPDEYNGWETYRDWNYCGATGTATYLAAILDSGATLANTWVSWDIFGFYQIPPFKGIGFLYSNMMTNLNQFTQSPRAMYYEVLTNQLAIRGQTVDSSSSNNVSLAALATSAGPLGPSALILSNNNYYPTQANIALHFQTIGQHTLSVYTIGNDNVGDGSGQGVNGTLTQTITVTTDNSGNAQATVAVSPWTVQMIAVSGG